MGCLSHFATAASMFMNSNTLPAVLIHPRYDVPLLKWGQDDTIDTVFGRILRSSCITHILSQVDEPESLVTPRKTPSRPDPNRSIPGSPRKRRIRHLPLPPHLSHPRPRPHPQCDGTDLLFMRLLKTFASLSPPLLASLFALFCVLVPLVQRLLKSEMIPFKGALDSAGACSVPVTLHVLWFSDGESKPKSTHS
ncbi:hypothetical protein OG21DRAFT_1484200 [Imleria badia]|nr:hypothetical protein OG21DRAFT_1484200 [Imleria badia]